MTPLGILTLIWLSLCMSVLLGAVQGAKDVRREGDPPRINARNLYEYRHMQLFNPDYVKWVQDNIQEIDYARKPGAMRLKWDALTDADLQASPVVVMVTQTTVSRLSTLRDVMQEWGGPVTVAVYIEYKASTEAADACERKVMQYIRETVAELWPSLEAAPATSVSFLYTSYDMPEAACDVELSGSVPAADSHPQPQAGAAQHDSELQQITDSGPHSLPQRLVTNHQQRSLQGAKRKPGSVQQGHSSKPAKPPPLKPVWHFRVRGGSMLKAPSRPWKELYDEFYPVNALRNLAWEQVPSGVFAFLIDVDFVPTPTLHADLTEGKWKTTLQQMYSAYFESQTREALVLPAFERLTKQGGGTTPWPHACEEKHGCKLIHGMALPRTFESLRAVLQKEKFQVGHGCYSWLTWLQDENPKEMVPMEYAHPCEPYVIALSDAMPRYDERFRGRGQNKIEQLTHMAMWGFNWRLLPGHFVLHVPHPATSQPDGGWDVFTTPLALLKAEIKEVENEPQFRRHVVQSVPLPVKEEQKKPQ